MLFIIASGRSTILDTMIKPLSRPVSGSQSEDWRLWGLSDLYSSIQQAEQVRHGTHTVMTVCYVPCTALSTSHVIIYHLTLKENPCDIDSITIPIHPRDEERLPSDPGCVQGWSFKHPLCADPTCYAVFSRVWLFVTPWAVASQVPLSTGFSWQEYCSGLPFPPSGDLPNPEIQAASPALQVDSHPWATGEARVAVYCYSNAWKWSCNL